MKHKRLIFLTALCLMAGLLLGAIPASAADDPPPSSRFFQMRLYNEPGTYREGDRFTVRIIGDPRDTAPDGGIASFSCVLKYPADKLTLESVAPGDGFRADYLVFNPNSGEPDSQGLTPAAIAGAAPGREGVTLVHGGSTLATVTFRVKHLEKGADYTPTLASGEITHLLQDHGALAANMLVSSTTAVHLSAKPLLAISKGTGCLYVDLQNRPAGTLITALYGEGDQMLRCQVDELTASKDPLHKDVGLDLTGAQKARAYYVDKAGVPLCPPAELSLP